MPLVPESEGELSKPNLVPGSKAYLAAEEIIPLPIPESALGIPIKGVYKYVYLNSDAIHCMSNILDIGDKSRKAFFILSIGSAMLDELGCSRIAQIMTMNEDCDFYILVLDGFFKTHKVPLEFIMCLNDRSGYNFRNKLEMYHGIKKGKNSAYLYLGGEDLPSNINENTSYNFYIQKTMESLAEYEKFKWNVGDPKSDVMYAQLNMLLYKFVENYPKGKIIVDNQAYFTTQALVNTGINDLYISGVKIGYNFESLVPLLPILFSIKESVKLIRTPSSDILPINKGGLYNIDDPILLEWPKKAVFKKIHLNSSAHVDSRKRRRIRKTRKSKGRK